MNLHFLTSLKHFFRKRKYSKDREKIKKWIYKSELEYWHLVVENGDIPPDENSVIELAKMSTSMKLRDWDRINKKEY